MDLAYFAADTLGVTLHQVKDKLVANETHELRFGSWRIEAAIDVESDCMTGTELGFWVTVAKKLKLYVIIKSKESFMFVLDDVKLSELQKEIGFVNQTAKGRVQEFKPAIRGVYHWKDQSWRKVNGIASV